MKIWGITDVGLVRRENQDAYAVESRNGFDICVVCDGMGGAAAGKLASEIAVRAYREALGETLREGMDLDAVQAAMAAAASQANRAIREEAARKPEYAGMGTTLVSAVSGKDGIVLSHRFTRVIFHHQNQVALNLTKCRFDVLSNNRQNLITYDILLRFVNLADNVFGEFNIPTFTFFDNVI